MVGKFTETDARDEYVDFLECFRKKYSGMKDTPEVFLDMVAFLMGMPELRVENCQNCPPSNYSHRIAVTHGVDSLMSSCLHGLTSLMWRTLAACTTEASLGTFKDLKARFSGGNIAGDPWSHVDSFGKSNFHKTLISVHEALIKSMCPDMESVSTTSPKEGGNSANSPLTKIGKSAPRPLPVLEVQSLPMGTLMVLLNLKSS